jgi:hypothetical protein
MRLIRTQHRTVVHLLAADGVLLDLVRAEDDITLPRAVRRRRKTQWTARSAT